MSEFEVLPPKAPAGGVAQEPAVSPTARKETKRQEPWRGEGSGGGRKTRGLSADVSSRPNAMNRYKGG